MPKLDRRVDAYIANSAEFAQPILRQLRAMVHSACPDVEETIKWSFPNFIYKGLLCNMASFKQHCSFGFWKSSLVVGTKDDKSTNGMGQFGRITSIEEVPSKRVLSAYIKRAMELNENGVKPARPKRVEKKELLIPAGLTLALKKNKKALAIWEGFSYSHKKEYVEWIIEAKTDETRNRRLATTLEWLAEGKSRNWKYAKC